MSPLWSRQILLREWIVFALSLGLGGHVVLAVVLHSPDQWPWHRAGGYALLSGVAVYVLIQIGRSLWWSLKGKAIAEQDSTQPGP
jgi:hypothetical protein